MANSIRKPKYIVEPSGKKSAVVISLADYEELRAAWEEVADAADFAAAKRTARKFVSVAEIRRQLGRKR